jgi:MYXO-CTERM domain-containing protein
MKRAWSSAALVLASALGASEALGQPWSGIIDSTRAIDWSTAGAGAIPARTTICTTLGKGGQSATSVQSVTVAQINSALAACPSGETVLLNPGTYDTAGATIAIPSHVTLRGSGPTKTIIAETGVPSSTTIPVIQFGTQSSFPNGPEPNPSTSTAITGGTSQGSLAITVASTTGISVGTLLMLTQSDLAYMTEDGTEGDCDYCAGVGGLSGQTVQVTAISGTSLTISDPLYLDYANTPLAYPFEVGCTSAGLEDVHISASDAEVQNTNNVGYSPNINFTGTIYSWVKNVESDFSEGSHVWIVFSMHNTIRDSFFHDGYFHGPGTTDDELRFGYKASANLVENNIFWRQHTSIMLEFGASGNVIAYNYSTGNYHDPSLTWLLEDIAFHGPHPMMNLFEGNISTHWQMDDIHGSSSHSTLFRNYSTGTNLYVPPGDVRGPLQMSAAMRESSGVAAYTLSYLAQYNNLVGVIDASDYEVNTLMAVGELLSPATSSDPACLSVGYADEGAGPSPNATQSTMLYQGVMDCVAGTFHWQMAALTLPASFYLPGKPAFWGSEPWPPIGPDVTGGDFSDWANSTASTTKGHVNKIPALSCFDTVTSNGTTNVTTFDAHDCYATSSPPGMDGGVHGSGDGGTVGWREGGSPGKDGGGVGPDGGSPGNGAATGGSGGGCGCRAGGAPVTELGGALALGLGLLAAARPRRRQTSRRR